MRPRRWDMICTAIATVVRSVATKFAKVSELLQPVRFKLRRVKATAEAVRRPGIGKNRSHKEMLGGGESDL
jgi:hypothetical protein